MVSDIPAEISDWAETIAQQLAASRIAGGPVHERAGILHAATADVVLAYQVLVTLSRTVALVLRPTGHEGGPLAGDLLVDSAARCDVALVRATQLLGFAAQGDFAMVDAFARVVLAAPNPLLEARTTLWAILEVLASEPVKPTPTEGPTS